MGSFLWRYLLGMHQRVKISKDLDDTYNRKLKIGSGTVVVISSPKRAKECFEQNGATTSDRPSLHVGEIVYKGLEMPLARYGKIRPMNPNLSEWY